MANFGKHFKKYFDGTLEKARDFVRDPDPRGHGQPFSFFPGVAGACGGIALYGMAFTAAPWLTVGFATASAVAGVAIGHLKDPGKDGLYLLGGLFSPAVVGFHAAQRVFFGALAGLMVAGRAIGAAIKGGLDAARDKSVSFSVDMTEKPAPDDVTQKALPAPATPDFVIAAQPKQPEREVIQITVERMNDKIRSL